MWPIQCQSPLTGLDFPNDAFLTGSPFHSPKHDAVKLIQIKLISDKITPNLIFRLISLKKLKCKKERIEYNVNLIDILTCVSTIYMCFVCVCVCVENSTKDKRLMCYNFRQSSKPYRNTSTWISHKPNILFYVVYFFLNINSCLVT
jgi:hypothetical protein